MDTKQQTMTSLAFPFDRDALVALESYAKNGHDYLQFSIGKHDDVIGLVFDDVMVDHDVTGLSLSSLVGLESDPDARNFYKS